MSPVSGMAESYRNVLVPVPTAGAGVCATCWRDVDRFSRCYKCHSHRAAAPCSLADVVAPIALAVAGEQFAYDLWQYKNHANEAIRKRKTRSLAAVLAQFLHAHESCLATACGVSEFDLVTVVPSTRKRLDHPLAPMLSRTIGRTSGRYANVLTSTTGAISEHAFHVERFSTSADLTGRRVLLIDDTWATGANAQSASARLKLAGAECVAVVVLGRWFDADHAPSQRYLETARKRPFTWSACCLSSSAH